MDVGVKDLDELRDFANYLRWLSETMVGEFSQACSRMAVVSENWTDTESERFMQEFSESVKQINGIAEMMEAFSQHVIRKCDILDMYRNASL